MANKKSQHPNLVTVRGADALRREQDRLAKAGYFPAPMPNDFGHSSGGGSGIGGSWEEYIHARLMCSEPGKGSGGNRLFPAFHLSSGTEVPTPDNIGTPGLGYMAWGADNRKPNVVTLLRESNPYTASAHRFNTDLCAGRGPQAMYGYTQYVGGNLTSKRVPFKDAGVLIKGWIRDLKRELQKEQQATVPDGSPSENNPAVSALGGSATEDSPLAKDLKEQIAALEKDYATWLQTRNEIYGVPGDATQPGFLQRNNLHLSWIQLTEDMQDQNLCFPEILLSKRQLDKDGKNVPTRLWTPKIVGIRYKMVHTCRYERMDQNGRINYVYTSWRWLDSNNWNVRPEDNELTAIRALDPQSPLTDMQRVVREARKSDGSIRKRPTHFILPVFYPSAGHPYYPFASWQSIFSGDIYEYLITMVSDRNKRRKNSNVIGRIIYLNQEYMERLYFQRKADTPEDKAKVFNELRNQINSFLQDRDNMGKPLVAYTFLGSDGKTYESWKIVEIESNSKSVAEANKEELAEISSVVFFAFGLDSQLVGNTPGTTTRSGGTDLRERFLLKQVQMSPMQQLLLLPLYLTKYFNLWDDHLEWEIPREVLTTLDNSKTGITTQPQE